VDAISAFDQHAQRVQIFSLVGTIEVSANRRLPAVLGPATSPDKAHRAGTRAGALCADAGDFSEQFRSHGLRLHNWRSAQNVPPNRRNAANTHQPVPQRRPCFAARAANTSIYLSHVDPGHSWRQATGHAEL
jgi:hypothetical protein